MHIVNRNVAHRESRIARLLSSRADRETVDTAVLKRHERRAQRRALRNEVPAVLEEAHVLLADIRKARAEAAAAEQAFAASHIEHRSWQESIVGRLSLSAHVVIAPAGEREVKVTRKAPMRRARSEMLRVYF